MNQTAMEKLLHDSFANYVVQTSLDFADEDQRIEVNIYSFFLYRILIVLNDSLSNVFVLYYLLFVQRLMVSVFIARYSVIQSPMFVIKHNSLNNVNVTVNITTLVIWMSLLINNSNKTFIMNHHINKT